MVVSGNSFLRDSLEIIKTDLARNVSDPAESKRINNNSKFIHTSYPQRSVIYPIITIDHVSTDFSRAGMQTTNMDGTLNMELRIWAKDVKQRDDLFNDVVNRLQSIQFSSTSGTVNNGMHDFNILSAVNIDVPGDAAPHSKVMEVQYKYFDL